MFLGRKRRPEELIYSLTADKFCDFSYLCRKQKQNIRSMAGIYIHIPFCKRRCIYCDFFSTTQSEKKRRMYAPSARNWNCAGIIFRRRKSLRYTWEAERLHNWKKRISARFSTRCTAFIRSARMLKSPWKPTPTT